MFVAVVEIGNVRMGVQERLVPVRMLMSWAHQPGVDVLMVGVVVDVLMVVVHGGVLVLVEVR